METNHSGAKYSSIVGIGEKLRKLSEETGKEYLYLNRGINQVVNIDLTEIIKKIDFNSNEIQYYPPNSGTVGLKNAINEVYFGNKTSNENIFVTAGGMHALSLIIQSLKTDKVITSAFFWGAYYNILQITGKDHGYYENLKELYDNPERYKDSVLIICDPNNPVGDKYDDELLLKTVAKLQKQNATVIWDSPYRRLFLDESDKLYQQLLDFDNVIISESFSKSVGLSGQRLGFVHTQNKEFQEELNIRLLYSGNGTNAFAQKLVELILTTPEGKKAANDFKKKTVADITANIDFLKEHNLLASEFYEASKPVGIFVIVNKSYEQLLEHNIGSVPMDFFTKRKDFDSDKFARICVSIGHEKFVNFFKKVY
ncbi:MAG: pyridoxal phosphate-dependent aminotransferase [Chlorobi bacterium]|nr:pyridoxal phosphate-dependent aminotransferase [Chlorobiota bacterium]